METTDERLKNDLDAIGIAIYTVLHKERKLSSGARTALLDALKNIDGLAQYLGVNLESINEVS